MLTILFVFNNSILSKLNLFEILLLILLIFSILVCKFVKELSIAFKAFDKSRFRKLFSKILKFELNSLNYTFVA